MRTDNVIQVAGIIDQAEADMLVACGVDRLGFPLRLPVHSEDLTEAAAADIIRTISPPAEAVVITYLNKADEIVAFCRKLGTNIVQLHGDIAAEELGKIKQLAPGLAVVKSLVIGRYSLDALRKIIRESSPFVDAYMTDTFDPNTGAEGATGLMHDWRCSRQLIEESPRPVILAGGLTPDNVRDAILTVRPVGVDAHTGLEDPSGRKNHELVARFIREARHAFAMNESKSKN